MQHYGSLETIENRKINGLHDIHAAIKVAPSKFSQAKEELLQSTIAHSKSPTDR